MTFWKEPWREEKDNCATGDLTQTKAKVKGMYRNQLTMILWGLSPSDSKSAGPHMSSFGLFESIETLGGGLVTGPCTIWLGPPTAFAISGRKTEYISFEHHHSTLQMDTVTDEKSCFS